MYRRITAGVAVAAAGGIAVALLAAGATAGSAAPGRRALVEVSGLNNRGQVVGTLVTRAGVHHGFAWRKGSLKLLGAEAAAINEHGAILGYTTYSDTEMPQGPVLWKNGKMRHLDLLPSTLNDRGQVLGLYRGRAALWSNGAITLLPLEPPIALNDEGQAVGATSVGGDLAEWDDGRLTDLGPGGYPVAINDRGEIVFNRNGDVIVWQRGTATDIGHGAPVAINDRGDVIWEEPPSAETGGQAFLWRDGKTIDLGGGTPNVTVALAAISDRGQVVGYHYDADTGVEYWFVWQDGNVTRLPTPRGGHIYFGVPVINDHDQILATVCSADCIRGQGTEFGLLWTLRGGRVDAERLVARQFRRALSKLSQASAHPQGHDGRS